LEICNWNLEASVLALCTAIGRKESAPMPIGHLASVSEERWRTIWAYYLVLRNWLPRQAPCGYPALLRLCDPDGAIQDHLLGLLGDRDGLKELYVERLCRCLEFWLNGFFPPDSAQITAHRAAVEALEAQIRKRDPEGRILTAFNEEGDGKLEPCHHKVLRRYYIITSSIGAGGWRAAMPQRGTDGLERAAALDQFLAPIEAWIARPGGNHGSAPGPLFQEVQARLGEPDAAKRFLASLLASLLRAQQLSARERAHKRRAKSQA